MQSAYGTVSSTNSISDFKMNSNETAKLQKGNIRSTTTNFHKHQITVRIFKKNRAHGPGGGKGHQL
jgi:hypothetical protein